MNSPTVDVIITTYRRPIKILKRALESVLKQTYSNIEIVVVNDFPEDKSLASSIHKLLNSYKSSHIHYLSYTNNMGACYARNFGAKYLNGDFIAFLDDDDEWLPEKIEKQLDGFKKPETGFVYSPFYGFGIHNEGTIISRGNCEGKITQNLLEGNKIGGCSMVTIRRSAFDQVGGFDESLKSLQDYDLWMRLSMISEAVKVDIPLIKRYLSNDSISVNFAKKKQGWEKFNSKYCYLYQKHPNIYANRLREMYYESMGFGHPSEAMHYWREAKQYTKIHINDIVKYVKGIIKLIIFKLKRIKMIT